LPDEDEGREGKRGLRVELGVWFEGERGKVLKVGELRKKREKSESFWAT